jgi:hypothetical protein
VDRLGQFRRRHGRQPSAVVIAPGADLGDDDEIVGVRVQRLVNDLVGDVGAVEVAGVDVVDAVGNRLAQHRDCPIAVLRRAEHAWSGELHRPVAEAVHAAVAEGECSGLAGVDHGGSPSGG